MVWLLTNALAKLEVSMVTVVVVVVVATDTPDFCVLIDVAR